MHDKLRQQVPHGPLEAEGRRARTLRGWMRSVRRSQGNSCLEIGRKCGFPWLQVLGGLGGIACGYTPPLLVLFDNQIAKSEPAPLSKVRKVGIEEEASQARNMYANSSQSLIYLTAETRWDSVGIIYQKKLTNNHSSWLPIHNYRRSAHKMGYWRESRTCNLYLRVHARSQSWAATPHCRWAE